MTIIIHSKRTLDLEGQRQPHQAVHQPPAHARCVLKVVDVADDVEGQLGPLQHACRLPARLVREEGEQGQVRPGEGGQRRLGEVVEGAAGQRLKQRISQACDYVWVNAEVRNGVQSNVSILLDQTPPCTYIGT